MEKTLSKSIKYISFQPHVDRKFVRIENREDIKKITDWLLKAKKKQGVASYIPASCKLIIHFNNLEIESILISPTGITKDNFFGKTIKSYQPSKSANISYKGYFMSSNSQPFTEILLRDGKFISKDQDPSRLKP